ncbi:MAG TPA: hypothetical protein VFK08_08725 [Rhodanobacteraceae bacterium]|nr:hypothetical protein [Rhodanobacteraceae bacterium]
MIDLPPIMRDQRRIDADHLRLLAIFHFIAAGFALLGLLFLWGHYTLMHVFMSDPKMWTSPHVRQGPDPAEFFAMFRWFYVVMGLWFFASGVLNLISAFCLRARRCRTFSIVVACINCLYMPLGTILGVFTILVLARDTVREAYETQ